MPSAPTTHPPYALATSRLSLRALLALAGRMPLGGDRETVLSALMAARLARGVLGPCPLSAPIRASRAAGARTWFAALTVPAPMRVAFAEVVDASMGEDRSALSAALLALGEAAGSSLDSGARGELRELANVVEAA